MEPGRKRWMVLLSGWTFIVLGIAGLFLPVLQGILLLMIGLIILSSEYAWAHRLVKRVRKRFPRAAAHFDEASEKARRWTKRTTATKSSNA